ncbi:MAG: dephospho-CoA kinase [Gemmatimonadota bacterium]|nr:dephospho-CoA kinase [Gemmatimonadota bacterium]
MRLVGLTGNIASGKTTVAGILATRGATVIDSDSLARQVVRRGSPGYRAIVERWGDDVTTPDGALDRAALRERVFSDTQALEELNEIVHPEVARLRETLVAEARERGDTLVVCDIPLLFERYLTEEFDVIVLVDAPREVRLERLVHDRGLHETDAMNMIAAQMPAELKRARADIVIDNAGSMDDLKRHVDEVWSVLRSETAQRDDGARPAFLDTPRRGP